MDSGPRRLATDAPYAGWSRQAHLVTLPDDRLTYFFVDKAYRRKRVAAAALRGVLDLIAKAGRWRRGNGKFNCVMTATIEPS